MQEGVELVGLIGEAAVIQEHIFLFARISVHLGWMRMGGLNLGMSNAARAGEILAAKICEHDDGSDCKDCKEGNQIFNLMSCDWIDERRIG
jgi:hypothetical protein